MELNIVVGALIGVLAVFTFFAFLLVLICIFVVCSAVIYHE